jgi:hypothetical protein
MNLSREQIEIINRCRKSVTFFLTHFGKIKHPSAGILPFRPFKYQKYALECFRKYRLNIFRKCRQSGASKISGAFATWFALFHSHKRILIVSRVNEDAMGFLRENIVFLYEHLPDWMVQLWKPVKQNEHEIVFPNGSVIKSLTSHPDVLRSNASSLNIIDEAAFIQGMDVLWAGGWSTLQHGGNVIVVSTTNGVGNWYWSACTDAEAGVNGFNPIIVNWWDMDWAIEYTDPLSKLPKRIAPCDGIRKCATPEEINKYGQYWSPWLEEQYRALQEQGESWKFQQEVLASFIGSGNTVLPKEVIAAMELTVEDPLYKVAGAQTYIHPVSGEAEELDFSFQDPEEGLWVWKQPVLATPDKRRGDVLIEKGAPAHSYVCGVDIATGKGKDYSAIQVFDLDTMEQVAEFMARVIPRDLVRFIDRIARWYNCATLVIERNNGGDIVIDEMRYNMMYPKLWRKKDINDKPAPASAKTRRKARPLKVSPYGFMTTQSSKSALNKYMLDCFREGEGGYTIYSRRLLKQFNTYVRKRDRVGRDTNRTEAEDGAGNFDDLVMATALALVALSDGLSIDPSNLMPTGSNSSYKSASGPIILTDAGMLEVQEDLAEKGGSQLLMPMSMSPEEVTEIAAQRVVDAFTMQLGGIPMSGARPTVVPSKFFYEKKDHY